ncbi:MAG: inositol monophosphatase family protein [Formosimonas sp.]
MSPMLNTAFAAARAAALLINKASHNLDDVKVGRKSTHELVTEIDQAAEEVIRETLLAAYPKHSFLGEESGFTGEQSANHRWIVDPIDGTSNFIHGYPHFAICIALEVDRKIEHALIYNPVSNDLFTATRGSGAFLNNRRIRVSNRIRFGEALLSSAIPARELRANPALIDLQTQLRFESGGLRCTGSAALDLAYVAAGYLDGFVGVGLKTWDVAAGALLVKEAGGLLTDLTGEGDFMSGNIIAATPKILPHLLKEVGAANPA